MEITELIEQLSRGEDTQHQFKVDISNLNSLAAELVAFSNSKGGTIFIGVRDDGSVQGLSNDAVSRLNQLISNSASQGVEPAVNPTTENVLHPSGTVMVVTVCEGLNKPYMDNNGVIWVKSGADKRRATSREELQRLFQQSNLLYAEKTPINGLGVESVDIPYFESYIRENIDQSLPLPPPSICRLLTNMNLMQNEQLNFAGCLLFAKFPQFALPAFIVKAVSYVGNDIVDQEYIDSVSDTLKVHHFRTFKSTPLDA